MLIDACVAPAACMGHGGRTTKNPLLDMNQSPINGLSTRPAIERRIIANKVGLGTRRVQTSGDLCRGGNDLLRTAFSLNCEYPLTQQVILIYSLYGRGNPLPN